jgi:hypothetical protein
MSTNTQRWTVETYDLDSRTHSTQRVAGCLDALIIIASALMPLLVARRRIRYRLLEAGAHRLTVDVYPADASAARQVAAPPALYPDLQWIPSPPATSSDRVPPDPPAAAATATDGESTRSEEVLP